MHRYFLLFIPYPQIFQIQGHPVNPMLYSVHADGGVFTGSEQAAAVVVDHELGEGNIAIIGWELACLHKGDEGVYFRVEPCMLDIG